MGRGAQHGLWMLVSLRTICMGNPQQWAKQGSAGAGEAGSSIVLQLRAQGEQHHRAPHPAPQPLEGLGTTKHIHADGTAVLAGPAVRDVRAVLAAGGR